MLWRRPQSGYAGRARKAFARHPRPTKQPVKEVAVAPKPLPEQSVLLQLLRYDRRTGKLYWRHRSDATPQWNGRYAGTEALASRHPRGYLHGHINGVMHRAHRVVWKLAYGEEPGPEIDHKSGNKANNRLNNLVSTDKAGNQKNCRQRRDNSTGRTGVYRHGRKWQARIHVNKRAIALGTFSTRRAAIAARIAGEKLHGYSNRHGRKSS